MKNKKSIILSAILIVCVIAGGYYFVSQKSSSPTAQKTEKPFYYAEEATGTLQEIGGPYTKDKNNVYSDGQIILGADHGTFVDLKTEPNDNFGDRYAKDDNHVYYYGKILEADLKTFVILGGDYAKDKNHVYFSGSIVVGADPETAVGIPPFMKDKNHLYGSSIININADLKSLTSIPGRVLKDKDFVYFPVFYSSYFGTYSVQSGTWEKISNADAPTFSYVGICEGCGGKGCPQRSYYKDKNRVFVNDKPMNNIDRSSFVYHEGDFPVELGGAFGPEAYATDRNFVYVGCDGNVLEGADPLTFEALPDSYAKDKNNVYFGDKIVSGVDPVNCTAANLDGCQAPK
jgi:hypothetical protein